MDYAYLREEARDVTDYRQANTAPQVDKNRDLQETFR